ncbi:MAG: hypothetical protein IIZ48_02820 [Erysipelotrichales bacterium]|nr:hypothetical protein [Erysipelotrichales bacterium]
MKKLLAGLLILMCVLAGCDQGTPIDPAEYVNLEIDLTGIENEFYTAAIEYYLNGELMGGLETGNADGTPYTDDTAVFRLDEKCFPEGADLKNFSFMVMLFDTPGNGRDISSVAYHIDSADTNICDPFDAAYGGVYRFRAEGNKTEGYTLKPAG